MVQLSNDFLCERYEKYTMPVQSIDVCTNEEYESITYEKIRDELYRDLQKLIRALEIYLVQYIEEQNIGLKVPEIEKLKPDHVLSFNYTDTYRKNVSGIHG